MRLIDNTGRVWFPSHKKAYLWLYGFLMRIGRL